MGEILWDRCPICGSKNIEELEDEIGICGECNHAFRLRIPGQVKPHYYQKGYWASDKNRQGITSVAPGKEWGGWVGSRIRLLKDFGLLEHEHPERVNIFEFGCSEGMVLYELKKRGYSVMGEDVCAIAGEAERTLGISIDTRPIEEFEAGGHKFDLIMSFHVMEHLRDPMGVMKKLGTMLSDGGRMLLHIPMNDDEYGNPDHFHFFSDASCRKLMEAITVDIQSDFTQYAIHEGAKAQAATYVGRKS